MKPVGFLLAALLIAPLARAETLAGDSAPPVLTISGKQVPLPEGNWIIAGRANGIISQGSGLGGFGTIWNIVLFRLRSDHTVDAMAEVNVNDMAVADGWGIAADCQRTDVTLTVVRSRSGWNAACFFLAHSTWTAANLPPAWQQARAFAVHRGLVLPRQTITIGFRAANRRDVIDARFHFENHTSDHRGRLLSDREIAAWAAMMIGCVEAGLKNRLPNNPVPAPDADRTMLERANFANRRQERLDYLRSAGIVSPEDYQRQLSLLRQAAARQDNTDPGTDEFYQLLGLQGLSVTSDALVTFMWTAQSVQAAALTLLQAGMRTGRSYLASYLWDQYSNDATRPDVARVVDFTYAGVKETQ